MPNQQQPKKVKLETRYGKIGISAVKSAAQYCGRKEPAQERPRDEEERRKAKSAPRK